MPMPSPAPMPSPMPGPAAMPGPAPLPPPPPLPLPAPPPLSPGDMVSTGMIRRAELRKHMKIQQQLKSITLALVVILLLAAYPVFLFARSAAADPVFAGLDNLGLPENVAYEHTDSSQGSRWCIGQCIQRIRTWSSTQPVDVTQTEYSKYLKAAGWTSTCARTEDDDKTYVSCWKKDEYVMVMYIQAPLCEAPPVRDPVPTTSASGETTDGGATTGDRTCPASKVTMYISNAIDEQPSP
jgi:hypothetical protein